MTLDTDEFRRVGYSAERVLAVFEMKEPSDVRPREAIADIGYLDFARIPAVGARWLRQGHLISKICSGGL